MIALDTSVAIQALMTGYEDHEAARRLVAAGASLPSHAVLETYSVLTRMPEPYRLGPSIAVEVITEAFKDRLLPPPSVRAMPSWLRRMAEEGIVGGAIYDALIAESARLVGARLVTADRRAASTYARVGVEVEILAS